MAHVRRSLITVPLACNKLWMDGRRSRRKKNTFYDLSHFIRHNKFVIAHTQSINAWHTEIVRQCGTVFNVTFRNVPHTLSLSPIKRKINEKNKNKSFVKPIYTQVVLYSLSVKTKSFLLRLCSLTVLIFPWNVHSLCVISANVYVWFVFLLLATRKCHW